MDNSSKTSPENSSKKFLDAISNLFKLVVGNDVKKNDVKKGDGGKEKEREANEANIVNGIVGCINKYKTLNNNSEEFLKNLINSMTVEQCMQFIVFCEQYTWYRNSVKAQMKPKPDDEELLDKFHKMYAGSTYVDEEYKDNILQMQREYYNYHYVTTALELKMNKNEKNPANKQYQDILNRLKGGTGDVLMLSHNNYVKDIEKVKVSELSDQAGGYHPQTYSKINMLSDSSNSAMRDLKGCLEDARKRYRFRDAIVKFINGILSKIGVKEGSLLKEKRIKMVQETVNNLEEKVSP